MQIDRIETISGSVGEKIAAEIQVKAAVRPKIRAGIVGAGLMGRFHAHALERAGGEVVAITDFAAAKAERLAASYKNAKCFSDVEKMFAAQKLDVLHVCSPTASHQIIAEKAIASGINLLIEKPFAATLRGTLKLYDLAAGRGVIICPVHQFAFQDGSMRAAQQLPKIGRVVHLEAKICSAGGDGLSDEQPDQIAWDILPHPLSLINRFLGSDIAESDWKVVRPANGELRISAQSSNGASVSIFISLNSRPTTNSFEIVGTDGTIYLDLFHGFSFVEPGKTSRMRKILHPFDSTARHFSAAAFNLARRAVRGEAAYPGLRSLIGKFYRAVENKTEPPIAPADTLAVAGIRDLLMNRAGVIEQTRARAKPANL